ncbi:hypothetical protein DL768_003799 [Monosporascus sp. mg162]|nr:hypothetical protein DL768_003799 [Monosporascus sp. mg162]
MSTDAGLSYDCVQSASRKVGSVIVGLVQNWFRMNGIYTGKAPAYAELRYVAAILLRDYDIEFAPGYNPMTVWRDMGEQVTAQPDKAMCVSKPRSTG